MVFEGVTMVKDLDLNLSFTVVFQDLLVGLTLPMTKRVGVLGGVWRTVVAGAHVREVALDVARGTAATGRGEANVIRHGC